MHYDIYVLYYGRSAGNAGIIINAPARRSKWADAGLTWEVYDDGRDHYTLDANSDERAYEQLVTLYRAKHPAERRPIAGKSYIRTCRASLRAARNQPDSGLDAGTGFSRAEA